MEESEILRRIQEIDQKKAELMSSLRELEDQRCTLTGTAVNYIGKYLISKDISGINTKMFCVENQTVGNGVIILEGKGMTNVNTMTSTSWNFDTRVRYIIPLDTRSSYERAKSLLKEISQEEYKNKILKAIKQCSFSMIGSFTEKDK